MDKSVYTAVSNIEKSYKLWENANNSNGKNLESNSKKIEAYKSSMKLLDDEIKKSEKVLADIGQQFGKNSKEYETYKSHVLDLKLKHSDLSQELTKTSKTTVTVSDKLKILDEGYQKTNTEINNIQKSYKLFELTQEKSSKGIFDNSKKVNSLKKEMSLLDGEIKKHEKLLKEVEQEYGKGSKEVQEYKGKILDLKIAHAELGKEIKKVEKETGTFSGRIKLLKREFENIDKKYEAFDTVGDKFKSIGGKLTTHVTLPVLGAGTAATKFAFDFEKGAAKVSTIADTTKVPIEQLKQGVIDLSNKTGMSTNELNESLYQAISGSVDTAKAVEFLDVAVKAAKGGFTETATAVDGLTTVLNSYGLEADKAKDISNQMLITQNLGKTTFGELASAVGKVTPIAANLGVTTQELFSSLASTTAQGLATSESVTALKAAMSNIIKPSKEAAEAAEILGIEFQASQVKAKGWMPFLQDMTVKLRQASPELDRIFDDYIKNLRRVGELENSKSKESKKELEITKRNLNSLKKEMELLSKASDGPISAMATMFGSTEALNSILMLTSDNGMAKYNESMAEMKTNANALDDAYNKMSQTTEAKFGRAMNKAKNSLMELGVKALPIVEKGIDLLSDLTDRFNKLSPATQENIIKIGLASAALGPFTSGIGGAVKGIGGLLKTGKKIGTFFGIFGGAKTAAVAVEGVGTAATVATGAAGGSGILGLASGLGAAILPFAPWILGAAGVAAAGYGIYKVLNQDANPAVDLFADKVETTAITVNRHGMAMQQSVENATIKISESTKKTVGAYMKLDEEVTRSLNSIYINSTKITEENKNQIVSKYEAMNRQVIEGINKREQEELKTLGDFFGKSSALMDKEEQGILETIKRHNEEKRQETDGYTKQITEIINKSIKERGRFDIHTMKEIEEVQKKMKTNAVKVLSENEIESKVILERMKEHGTQVTKQMASDNIKALNEQRDKAIKAAQEQYDKVVKEIIRQRDETKTISSTQADTLIKDAQKQRDKTVEAANQTRSQAVDTIFKMNRELIEEVDASTGEVITTWNKLTGTWERWKPSSKTLRVTMDTSQVYDKMRHIGNGKFMGPGYATGTKNATRGLHEVAEEGFEIVASRQHRWFNGGEKVYNHSESKKILNSLRDRSRIMESIASETNSLSRYSNIPLFNKPEALRETNDFQSGDIIIPINIAGEEIDRVVVPRVSNKLALNTRGRR